MVRRRIVSRSLQLARYLVPALLLLGCLKAAWAQESSGQQPMVQQVEAALRSANGLAVQDLGHLLKPGGVQELQKQADQLRSQGINVYYVTVPKGTPADGIAETAYRELGMGGGDLLVVFDGRQVYGKAIALQGQPQAFQDAFRAAAPGFKLYYARGLAQFVDALRDQILSRQAAADTDAAATRQHTYLFWGGGIVATLIVLAIFLRPRRREEAPRHFGNR